MSPLRRIATPILLIALGLGVGAAFSELVVRVVAPQPVSRVTPGLYESDPHLRYRLAPGYRGRVTNVTEFDTEVAIDDHGLRNAAVDAAPPVRPLLVIGDSYAFGWGVEESETLAARLGAALGVAAANGGVPGYGVPDAVAWLEHYGMELEPREVVLAIFVGNDLIDATARHGSVEIEEGRVTGFAGTNGLKARIYERSHLFRLIKRVVPSGLRRALGLGEPWAQVYLRETLESYALNPPPLLVEGRRNTEAALDRFRELAGAGARVVLVPGPLDVDPLRWQRALAAFGLDPDDYRPEVPGDYLVEACRARGLPVLDLTPAFRRAQAGGESLFFRDDPHWTAAGHQLAASEVADWLSTLSAPSSSTVAEPVGDGTEPPGGSDPHDGT